MAASSVHTVGAKVNASQQTACMNTSTHAALSPTLCDNERAGRKNNNNSNVFRVWRLLLQDEKYSLVMTAFIKEGAGWRVMACIFLLFCFPCERKQEREREGLN